jgi:hypothetical protein
VNLPANLTANLASPFLVNKPTLQEYVHLPRTLKQAERQIYPLLNRDRPNLHCSPDTLAPYFFFPFLLLVEPPALELVEATLEARDGMAELFLLDLTDLTWSSALF